MSDTHLGLLRISPALPAGECSTSSTTACMQAGRHARAWPHAVPSVPSTHPQLPLPTLHAAAGDTNDRTRLPEPLAEDEWCIWAGEQQAALLRQRRRVRPHLFCCESRRLDLQQPLVVVGHARRPAVAACGGVGAHVSTPTWGWHVRGVPAAASAAQVWRLWLLRQAGACVAACSSGLGAAPIPFVGTDPPLLAQHSPWLAINLALTSRQSPNTALTSGMPFSPSSGCALTRQERGRPSAMLQQGQRAGRRACCCASCACRCIVVVACSLPGLLHL